MVRESTICSTPFCSNRNARLVSVKKMAGFKRKFDIRAKFAYICDACKCFTENFSVKKETVDHVKKLMEAVSATNEINQNFYKIFEEYKSKNLFILFY
jgi:hypothetical protein